MRQHNFVTVPIDGEHLYRTPDDGIGAVAGFAFPKDQRRGRELNDLGNLGKGAELVGPEMVEQREALEELFAFRSNHASRNLQFLDLLILVVSLSRV